jgi:ribonuclease P protein component
VVYLLPSELPTDTGGESDSRFGLIVGRTVGGSVVRHQVSRRLRHQLRDRLDRVPSGSRVVVRALPEAAAESSADVARDLDAAFDRLARKTARNAGTP